MKIIDAHSHIGSCHWHGQRSEFRSPDESVDFLRSCGICLAHFNPWQAVLCETERDLNEGNAEALELYHKHPDFLHPGCSVDFRWPHRSLEWLEIFRGEGLNWVGEIVPKAQEGDHPFTAPAWRELFEYISAHKMVLQLHNSSGTACVAKAYPELTVIGSHLYPDCIEELCSIPNVSLDISGMHGGLCLNALKNACRLFGAGRLLFGTDYEYYDPLCFITRVKSTFTHEEQTLVFAENFRRMLPDI